MYHISLTAEKLQLAPSFHSPFDLWLWISLNFDIERESIAFFWLDFLVQILQDNWWGMNNKLPEGWRLTDLINSHNLKWFSLNILMVPVFHSTCEKQKRAGKRWRPLKWNSYSSNRSEALRSKDQSQCLDTGEE